MTKFMDKIKEIGDVSELTSDEIAEKIGGNLKSTRQLLSKYKIKFKYVYTKPRNPKGINGHKSRKKIYNTSDCKNRKYNCKFYDRCLDRFIFKYKSMDCQKCKRYIKIRPVNDKTEVLRCLALWHAAGILKTNQMVKEAQQ